MEEILQYYVVIVVKLLDMLRQRMIDLNQTYIVMIVDNFKLINSLLEFKSPEDFYFVQILQRRKDDNQVGVSSNYRVVKSYYIYSHDELIRREEKIKELCENNNARAYIWLNPRNTEDISWDCIDKFLNLIKTKNTSMCYRVFDRACGSVRNKKYVAKWIVDLDNKDPEYKNKIVKTINECEGNNDNHVLYEIPTVHGIHLITEPFNLNKFYQLLAMYKLENVDIHKDNPTLLYY